MAFISNDDPYDYEAEGEVIKMIHGELPAVRWGCGGCGEDSCTIFEPTQGEKVVGCEYCDARNLVSKGGWDSLSTNS